MTTHRQKMFSIACASASTNITGFARAQGVSDTAIRRVLEGKSTSRRLESAINSFVSAELKKLKVKLLSDAA